MGAYTCSPRTTQTIYRRDHVTSAHMTLDAFKLIRRTPTAAHTRTAHARTNFGSVCIAFDDGIKTDEIQAVVSMFQALTTAGDILICTIGIEDTQTGKKHLHVAFVSSFPRRNRYYNEKIKPLFSPERLIWTGGRTHRNIYSKQPATDTSAAVWLAYPLKEGFVNASAGDFDNGVNRWLFAHEGTGIRASDPVVQQQLALGCEYHLTKRAQSRHKRYRITLETAPEVIHTFKTVFDAFEGDETVVETLTRMFFHHDPEYNFKSFFKPKTYDQLNQLRLHTFSGLLERATLEEAVQKAISERVCMPVEPRRKRKRFKEAATQTC